MTATHHSAAEIAKLARVLELTDSAELDFLAELPPAAIRAFRDQVAELIARRDARRMQRIGAAAKLVPAAVSAKITEAAFGPVLAAAVAGSVEPARAVAIAGALSPAFLADATVTLDPHRATELIAHVPTAMAAAVARELIDRGDYLTMGRLAGSVPDPALRAALPHAADIDLLHVGYYLENTAAADHLLTLVADRIPGMLRAAHAENQWAEAITLLDLVGPAERARIATIAADQDDEVIDGLLTAVRELDAWDTLLPITSDLPATALRRLAERPVLHSPEALVPALKATATHDLWPHLLPLVDALPTETHPTLAATIATLTDTQFHAAAHAALPTDTAASLFTLVLHQAPTQRGHSLTLLDDSPDLPGLIASLPADSTVWPRLRDISTEIPARSRALVAERAAQCGLTEIAERLA